MSALTDNQREVLESLRYSHDGSSFPQAWCTPLDLGGGSRSHHSGTLNALAKKGLVQFKQRGMGVRIEAAHQIERWSADHDAGKTPFDWFWLLGYLAQKAADAQVRGDLDKAKHHTISTAAALLNWHAALTGRSNVMRPGIDAVERGI